MQLIEIPARFEPGEPMEEAARRNSELSEVIAATQGLYQRRGYMPPWTGYLARRSPAGEWLGACGFAAPPKDGEVELAYFTFPAFEGQGVATQMAHALLQLARPAATAAGVRFIAHTLPQESASTRILRRLGFGDSGAVMHPEDGVVWKWCLPA